MPINLDHPSFIIPESNSIIFRYVDIEKFESLLKTSSLFFCRSDKFADPFEGSLPKREVEHRPIESMSMASFFNTPLSEEAAINNSNGLGELHKRFRKSLIVNCWHINRGESEAMWRLYLKSNDGVALVSSIEGLINAFKFNTETVFMSKVRYINYDTDIFYDKNEYPNPSYTMFVPFVHKRTAFAHESELRIFQQIESAVNDDNYWDVQQIQNGLYSECQLKSLIHKIILHPTADDTTEHRVRQLLVQYGFDIKIEKSRLNDEPVY